MKEYHVVFEGLNGFQLEKTLGFINDLPPPTYYMREYQQFFAFEPLIRFGDAFPPPEARNIKDRCFRQRSCFYALGKNIVYYIEEC